MTNPTITIHNVETDEVIEREMNAEELAQLESDQIAETARKATEALKAADKATLLAKLGITQEEALLLLS